MYEYRAKIINVVDGDTFDMDIDLGFHIHIHERVRVLDLDTPEKRGAEKELGQIVTEFAMINFLEKEVVIHSQKEILPKTDSFGRWLVDVIITEGDYAFQSVVDIYTSLGVNKYAENYSEANVRMLTDLMCASGGE